MCVSHGIQAALQLGVHLKEDANSGLMSDCSFVTVITLLHQGCMLAAHCVSAFRHLLLALILTFKPLQHKKHDRCQPSERRASQLTFCENCHNIIMFEHPVLGLFMSHSFAIIICSALMFFSVETLPPAQAPHTVCRSSLELWSVSQRSEPGATCPKANTAKTELLEQCFKITRLIQIPRTKFRYECKLCKHFDRFLESSQKAVRHAMAMLIHGTSAKVCPARGSVRAGLWTFQ